MLLTNFIIVIVPQNNTIWLVTNSHINLIKTIRVLWFKHMLKFVNDIESSSQTYLQAIITVNLCHARFIATDRLLENFQPMRALKTAQHKILLSILLIGSALGFTYN